MSAVAVETVPIFEETTEPNPFMGRLISGPSPRKQEERKCGFRPDESILERLRASKDLFRVPDFGPGE
jgi:hypothetical protein